MADQKISAATQVTTATAGTLFAASQSTTDYSVPFSMVGLEYSATTVTTADVTGAVGIYYDCDISGITTASKNITLPTPAKVGQLIAVGVSTGDDTYELIIKGAATVTINGGSAATEWSRLFISGEVVVFYATSTTNWNVLYDGRIPCVAFARQTSTVTTSTAGTTYSFDYSANFTIEVDNGSIVDSTNDVIVPRRSGAAIVSIVGGPQANPDADDRYQLEIQNNTSGVVITRHATRVPFASTAYRFPASSVAEFDAGDNIDYQWLHADAPNDQGLLFGRMGFSEVLI